MSTPPTPRRTDFLSVLASAQTIEKQGSVFKLSSFIGTEQYVDTFNRDDLAKVHEHLPVAVNAMFAATQASVLTSSWVRNTLDYWAAPIKIRSNHNIASVVTEVGDIVAYSATKGQVTLTALRACYLEKSGNVEYATNAIRGNFYIDASEMERLFPGWLERYTVQLALGYTGRDLVTHVLSQQVPGAANSLPLPDISF